MNETFRRAIVDRTEVVNERVTLTITIIGELPQELIDELVTMGEAGNLIQLSIEG